MKKKEKDDLPTPLESSNVRASRKLRHPTWPLPTLGSSSDLLQVRERGPSCQAS